MLCQTCEHILTDPTFRFCPFCGTKIPYSTIQWNVFSQWRDGYSTRYGGMIPFSKESVLQAERANYSNNHEQWLGSYDTTNIVDVPGSEFSVYPLLSWERIVRANGTITLEQEEQAFVLVTSLE